MPVYVSRFCVCVCVSRFTVFSRRFSAIVRKVKVNTKYVETKIRAPKPYLLVQSVYKNIEHSCRKVQKK